MKYKIGKYVVDAKSPLKAHQAVKLIKQHAKQNIKDRLTNSELNIFAHKIEKTTNEDELKNVVYEIINYDKSLFNKLKNTFDKQHFDFAHKRNAVENTLILEMQHSDDSVIKDEAFDRQTIEALIADETSAIDSYNVAIANLKGKLSDEAIKVLQAIRDDEQNHVANLNAILSNNITEKNLEDSIKDAEYKVFYKGKELKRGDELIDFRGDKHYYYGCYHPRKITVSEDKVGNNLTEAYPSVFNVEIKA